ncbi:NAD(P)H-binding protein [Enterococcus sp. 669A]|uniref:NAD(P)H-binding protein n=1 Tax=Candidatus Enterococcus moelleringii TaxID=2815325 RepID=A0ABS3LBE8_9ENTE|nr:NAD(P)H-binding protein [Enterococcus sp. 669A]MBO1306061.1 NAD(P)H-binding protein [Enterococcus sp. 669A]
MKIMILGAAGEIAGMLRERLLKETDHALILYARNAEKRIKNTNPERVTIVSGDFNDQELLEKNIAGVDLVYLNDMNSPEATKTIVSAMQNTGVPWIIGATILGIYDEVVGEFGKWNARMVGTPGTNRHKESSAAIEESGLSFTLLRLTWLYNEAGNTNYMISQKGEPFIGAEVSREAVTQLILDILADLDTYKNTSLGVSEPDTDFAKPSFY